MKTFIIRGLLLTGLLSGCGGEVEPSTEVATAKALESDLPACEEVHNLTCRIVVSECIWQSTGEIGACRCKRLPEGLRWQCL